MWRRALTRSRPWMDIATSLCRQTISYQSTVSVEHFCTVRFLKFFETYHENNNIIILDMFPKFSKPYCRQECRVCLKRNIKLFR